MYLTAHRVQRKETGQTGINTFWHKHNGGGIPGIDWRQPNIEFIAQKAPGKLIAEKCEVLPGGNWVLSYLDIVAPEGTNAEQLKSVLHRGGERTNSQGAVRSFENGIVLRFNAILGLPDTVETEYKHLSASIEALIDDPTPPKRLGKDALTIFVDDTPAGLVFELNQADRARLLGLSPSANVLSTFQVPKGVYKDFKAIHGEIFPHAVALLTGYSVEQVLNFGGARVVARPSGKVLWET